MLDSAINIAKKMDYDDPKTDSTDLAEKVEWISEKINAAIPAITTKLTANALLCLSKIIMQINLELPQVTTTDCVM